MYLHIDQFVSTGYPFFFKGKAHKNVWVGICAFLLAKYLLNYVINFIKTSRRQSLDIQLQLINLRS